ncbi:MarR family transcriptional regulator [Bacillus sp. JJ1122]|uniref:MarR family winged helix-turn-helix transcriptional regulator n=1 Tax=Bacillus sp. JJ1122 TaxID=3122951 RepID=UPI002FFF8F2E
MERKCTNQPFLLLMHTSKAIQEKIRDRISSSKLNLTEFSVLEVLYHRGQQTIQQIGSSILISSSSMTYVIDKLEQRGLLRRSPCANDRRVIHVVMTPEGTALMDEIMPEHHEMVDSMFGLLSEDEKQLFVELLKKISV